MVDQLTGTADTLTSDELARNDLAADVARRLSQPEFRDLLEAKAPDGSRPIIPAFQSDNLGKVLAEVHADGGAANVVVPVANGYLVISLTLTESLAPQFGSRRGVVSPRITIKQFIARLFKDGAEVDGRLIYTLESGADAGRAVLGIAA